MNFKYIFIGLVALILAGCSSKEPADPVNAFGDDASLIIAFSPKELVASAGGDIPGQIIDRMGEDGKDVIDAIKSIKGIDTECVAFGSYGSESMAVCALTSGKELRKSLESVGYKAVSIGHRELFCKAGVNCYIEVDDDYMRCVFASTGKEAAEILDAMATRAATPLKEWKRKALAGPEAVRAVAHQGEFTTTFTARLSGPALEATITNVNPDEGTPTALANIRPEEFIGSWASSINADANLAFACGKGDFLRVFNLANDLLGLQLSAKDMAETSDMISGPIWGDITLGGESIMDLEKIAANLSITASSPRAASAIFKSAAATLGDEIGGLYMTPESFTAGFTGAKINGSLKGDQVTFATAYQTPGHNVNSSDLANCCMWAKAQLPPKLVADLSGVEGFGVSAELKFTGSQILITAEFTDTDRPFLECLSKALNR